MGSENARLNRLPRVVIDMDKDSQAVIELRLHGILVSERLVTIEQLDWSPESGDCNLQANLTEIKTK